MELKAYFRGFHPGALGAGRQLVASYDFSYFHRLMDAGGGSGGLVTAACKAHPQLQSIVVELPAITSITEHSIAEAGIADQE